MLLMLLLYLYNSKWQQELDQQNWDQASEQEQ